MRGCDEEEEEREGGVDLMMVTKRRFKHFDEHFIQAFIISRGRILF